MATSVYCDIVSAEESIFSGEVALVSLTGEMGDLGIMPGHSPLLTSIKPGPVHLRRPSGEEDVLYVSGGYMEVQPTMVTILANTALRADDLDEAKSMAAIQEAEQQMADKNDQFDYTLAAAQLAQAAAQLRTIKELRQLGNKLGK